MRSRFMSASLFRERRGSRQLPEAPDEADGAPVLLPEPGSPGNHQMRALAVRSQWRVMLEASLCKGSKRASDYFSSKGLRAVSWSTSASTDNDPRCSTNFPSSQRRWSPLGGSDAGHPSAYMVILAKSSAVTVPDAGIRSTTFIGLPSTMPPHQPPRTQTSHINLSEGNAGTMSISQLSPLYQTSISCSDIAV